MIVGGLGIMFISGVIKVKSAPQILVSEVGELTPTPRPERIFMDCRISYDRRRVKIRWKPYDADYYHFSVRFRDGGEQSFLQRPPFKVEEGFAVWNKLVSTQTAERWEFAVVVVRGYKNNTTVQRGFSGCAFTWVSPTPTPRVIRGDLNGNNKAYERGDVMCGIVNYLKLDGRPFDVGGSQDKSVFDVNKDNVFDRKDVVRLITNYMNRPRTGKAGKCVYIYEK